MLRCFRLTLLFFAYITTANAQAVGSSLQGAVTDPTGAVVPNAQVEIRNRDTAAVAHLQTDSAGHFREPLLPLRLATELGPLRQFILAHPFC